MEGHAAGAQVPTLAMARCHRMNHDAAAARPWFDEASATAKGSTEAAYMTLCRNASEADEPPPSAKYLYHPCYAMGCNYTRMPGGSDQAVRLSEVSSAVSRRPKGNQLHRMECRLPSNLRRRLPSPRLGAVAIEGPILGGRIPVK